MFSDFYKHYFYLLPFKNSNHFKVGKTSGGSYARLKNHVRKISINPKGAILVYGDKEQIFELEDIVLNQFSEYNRAEEVKGIYGHFGGYKEVFSNDCYDQVLEYIDTIKDNPSCKFLIFRGLSLKGIFTDNNIDETEYCKKVQPPSPLLFTELYRQLINLINTPKITRVNYGYYNKVSYLGLYYLIEAEEGFKHPLFDTQFTDERAFCFKNQQVKHRYFSGQKLRSGGTYLWGKLEFPIDIWGKKNLITEPYEDYSDGMEAEIRIMNLFFERLSVHPARDINFKVISASCRRSDYKANFISCEIGQKVRIAKSLELMRSYLQ